MLFFLDTIGLLIIWERKIDISAEFLAPDGSGVNNGNFHSLVRLPVNIPPIITQLTDISNGDLAGCQEVLVVGKDFILFLKYRLRGQKDIIFVYQNGQNFGIPF